MEPIEAIQGPQGEQVAVIRSLCRMLDIAHQMQMLRIKRNPALEQRIILLEQDRLGRRLGSGTRLSAAQVGQIFMQLALLREQTGIPVEEAEKRLAAQFEVAHIIDIDSSEWAALNHAILALLNR